MTPLPLLAGKKKRQPVLRRVGLSSEDRNLLFHAICSVDVNGFRYIGCIQTFSHSATYLNDKKD
jgi:hypothetical protein